jgi:hypothetical protein
MTLDGIRPDDVYYDKKPANQNTIQKRFHVISNIVYSGKLRSQVIA